MSTTLPTLDELRLHPLFNALKPKLTAPFSGQLWLALSGGVDSVALLYLSAAMGLEPKIIHVHHGLQDQADQWAELCQTHAKRLGLPIVTEQLSLGQASEVQAREQRYRAIAGHLQTGDTLLLAHHASDQLETLLMRLCRGTSVHGLSGIASKTEHLLENKSITLWRPLLTTSKSALEQLASQFQLEFATDPSNKSIAPEANLRAYLRAQVIPKLEGRFNALEKNILRSADLMAESASILDEVCDQDLRDCCTAPWVLSLAKLTELSPARRRAVLSRFMTNHLAQRPSRDKVLRLEALVLGPPSSGHARFQHGGFDYRCYAGQLHQIPSEKPASGQALKSICLGKLGAEHTLLDKRWRTAQNSEHGLCPNLLTQTLKLDPVLPGSRLNLLSRSGSRSIKKILQEKKVAPWLRRMCLIVSHQETPLGLLTPHEFLLCHSRFITDHGWTLCLFQPNDP